MRSEEFITEMPSINPSLDFIMTKLDDPDAQKHRISTLMNNAKPYQKMKNAFLAVDNKNTVIFGIDGDILQFMYMWDTKKTKYPVISGVWRNKNYHKFDYANNIILNDFINNYGGIISDTIFSVSGKKFFTRILNNYKTVYVLKDNKTIHDIIENNNTDNIVDKYSGETSEYSQYTFLITDDVYDIGDKI